MSTVVQLTLTVGDPGVHPDRVSLAEAGVIAGLAEQAGVSAIRFADAGRGVLDPTVVIAYLAGRYERLGFIAEVPTTHQAPYNTARRVLSLDRATGGRIGLALTAGAGDEVTDATQSTSEPIDPGRRWAEYAHVLTRLWESFPQTALIGDQETGVVADDTLIRPIGHAGEFYRVAGPLDGPSSAQGRPVLLADAGDLGFDAVAATADVVVVGRSTSVHAHEDLTAALDRVGRPRGDVTLLGRVVVRPDDPLLSWAGEPGFDGVELVPTGGADAVAQILRRLPPSHATASATLRVALGLPSPAPVAPARVPA